MANIPQPRGPPPLLQQSEHQVNHLENDIAHRFHNPSEIQKQCRLAIKRLRKELYTELFDIYRPEIEGPLQMAEHKLAKIHRLCIEVHTLIIVEMNAELNKEWSKCKVCRSKRSKLLEDIGIEYERLKEDPQVYYDLDRFRQHMAKNSTITGRNPFATVLKLATDESLIAKELSELTTEEEEYAKELYAKELFGHHD